MKKFLLIAVLGFVTAFASNNVQAQVSLYGSNGYVRDTVSNTGVKYLTSVTPVPAGFTYRATVTVQVDITKISGTLGGTLIPVGSNDGVSFYALTGSLTVADIASQGIVFACTTGYKHYGVKWTGTGTMSGSFVTKLYTTKP